ncbi:MAG: hypothetical protein LBP22_12060 [Deltaproteobacteria bacterium]|jgi:H2-forming N5,N10-methylenetetrahydromethanopterin dehydrogenase-like enzyme|nr:hypothetical protein [Deltaproteobacteria bacterium]
MINDELNEMIEKKINHFVTTMSSIKQSSVVSGLNSEMNEEINRFIAFLSEIKQLIE